MSTFTASLFGVVSFFFLISPCLSMPSRPLTAGLARDRSALLALANSMDKFGRSRMGAWKTKGNPCFPKPWPHMSCANGRVTGIDLANLELVGTLPPQLKRLNKLESLNLENNQLAGTIPDGWSDRQQFQSLRTLNLGNNLLSGTLPNARWNRKNAFRSLEELNLAENRITGGLPDGWLGGAKPFRRLKFLDLSDNLLGSISGAAAPYEPSATPSTYGWCLQHSDATRGWCPTAATPPSDRLPVLETLDVSQNGLSGEVPTMWSRMFPNLQALLIHSNGLYNGVVGDKPAALPTTWTRLTVPRAFPQLQSLVLYPGNDNICSLPNGEGSFMELNGDLSYMVESEDEVEFDADNPWFCPGSAADNPPASASLGRSLTSLELSFATPATNLDKVYGYRVTFYKKNIDTDEFEPIAGWIGRLFKVYGVNPSAPGADELVEAAGSYSLSVNTATPAIAIAVAEEYQVDVTTYNLNTEESTTITSTYIVVNFP